LLLAAVAVLVLVEVLVVLFIQHLRIYLLALKQLLLVLAD
jgi:hypothetical protein